MLCLNCEMEDLVGTMRFDDEEYGRMQRGREARRRCVRYDDDHEEEVEEGEESDERSSGSISIDDSEVSL